MGFFPKKISQVGTHPGVKSCDRTRTPGYEGGTFLVCEIH